MNTDAEILQKTDEMQGTEDQSHDLSDDTSVLQKNDDVSTSLCDRFGIHMYSSEFLEQETHYKERQDQENTKIFHAVMHNSKNEKTEESFQQVIQAEGMEVIKANYARNVQGEAGWLPAAYILLGALVAGTVLFLIEKMRRKRREDNNYNTK